MPNNLNEERFPTLKRVAQVNGSYCGPATLQMLLGFYQVEIDQEEVVTNLQIKEKVNEDGMAISEMGEYVKKFQPELEFWYKFDASASDISGLINDCKIPVGIEWQGVFDYPDADIFEDEDDDEGHISVVTGIDINGDAIFIADPHRNYFGKDRKFAISQFVRRWWDIDVMIDLITNKREAVEKDRGLFCITKKEDNCPERFGLVRI